MPQQFVVLGIGGNLGDRIETFRRAVSSLLRERGALENARAAELFESEALLLPDAPVEWNLPFFNTAVSGLTLLTANELLRVCKEVERELGRETRARWAPREIDIDILVYGNDRLHTQELSLPHPGLIERPFALWPLSALAPDYRLPQKDGDYEIVAARAAAQWGFIRSEIPCKTWRASWKAQQHWRESMRALGLSVEPGPLAPTELVGILNITPDSFSDGGRHLKPEAALEQARKLCAAGATVLDIGAESTRPQAAAISPDEEWKRLAPVLESLRHGFERECLKPALSIDTRNAETARRALEFSPDWINDVEGFTDPSLLEVALGSQCDLVVMHSLGIPPSSERLLSPNERAIDQIIRWGEETITRLEGAGVRRERIILDPGIGFGKSAAQSFEIVGSATLLRSLGVRVLIGHSRKSFLSLITERPFSERDPESAFLSAQLARDGIEYLRVHDVSRSATAINLLYPWAGASRGPATVCESISSN